MEDTTDLTTMVTTTARDKLRMSPLLPDLIPMLRLSHMVGVSLIFIFSTHSDYMINSGYGGYYRPYWGGYYYGKRQAEDEPAASGPNPDAEAEPHYGYWGGYGYYRPYYAGYYWGK